MKNSQRGFSAPALMLIILVIIAVGGYWYSKQLSQTPVVPITPAPVACTMDAKICPDGSAVGRQGPNCEFAACPSTFVPPVIQQGITLNLEDGSNTTGRSFEPVSCPSGPSCDPAKQPYSWYYNNENVILNLRFYPAPTGPITLDYLKRNLDVAVVHTFALPGYSQGDFDVTYSNDQLIPQLSFIELTPEGVLRGVIDTKITQLNFHNRRPECRLPVNSPAGGNTGGDWSLPSYCSKSSQAIDLPLTINFSFRVR